MTKAAFRQKTKKDKGGKLLFYLLCSLSVAGIFAPINLSLLGLSSMSYYLQLLGLLATAALVITNLGHIYFDLSLLFTLLFCACALLSTSLYGDVSTYYLKTLVYFVQTWAVVNIGVHRNPDWLLQSLAWVLTLFVAVNFVFMAVYYPSHPFGFSGESNIEMWPLGHKNQIRNWVFPLITVLALLDTRKGKYLKPITYIIMIVCIISVYLANSATSTVLVIIFCILLVLRQLAILGDKQLNSAVASIAYFVVFFVVVVLRKVPLIGEFITNVLGRDLTFTGRSEIWDIAIESILKNPVLGVGYHEIETTKLITPYDQKVTHAHEALLDTAYKYGFVGLFLVSLLGLLAVIRLYADRRSKTTQILSTALMCYLICGVFGELFNMGFYLILILGCYCKYLNNNNNEI